MKTAIKFFSISVFLVCIFPMFQMCSDESIREWMLNDEVIVDSTTNNEAQKQINDSQKKRNQNQKDIRLRELRREYTFNAYQFGFSNYRKFEIRYLKDWTFYFSLCFTILILISLIIFVYAFKKKFAQVFKLSILNLALLLCSILILIFKQGVVIIDQIRYGYYILILNIIILIMLSKIQINRNSG